MCPESVRSLTPVPSRYEPAAWGSASKRIVKSRGCASPSAPFHVKHLRLFAAPCVDAQQRGNLPACLPR